MSGPVIIAGRRWPDAIPAQESATLPSSILVRPGDPAVAAALTERPAFAADLHLAEVVDRLVADRDPAARAAIEAWSFTRLPDPDAIAFRHEVFRDLDRLAPASTILASNSSGLPITALAAATDRPDRVIGWHWASPAPVMKLAEIVVTPMTSDPTIAMVRETARGCGKNPIVVKDNPMAWGYVANRVYFAMVREAQRAVDEGLATRDEVDQLMMDCFRWPSGPFGMVKGAGSGWG